MLKRLLNDLSVSGAVSFPLVSSYITTSYIAGFVSSTHVHPLVAILAVLHRLGSLLVSSYHDGYIIDVFFTTLTTWQQDQGRSHLSASF